MTAPLSPGTTLVLLYQGARAVEALGAHAALRAAGRACELVAADALVATLEGARVVPHRLGYSALPQAEAVVLPGGDVARPLRDPALARALRERRGKWTLASGEAVRLAAAAGLTDARRVARGPGEAPIEGTESRAARLVADGRLLTCAGGDALVDLALHLVAQLDGEDAAKRAAHAMGREWRPFVMGAGVD